MMVGYPSTTADNLSTALDLARSGFSVFPCHEVDGPAGADGEPQWVAKSPKPGITWRMMSTTNELRIRQWWQRWPFAAIGLDLAKSGLLVIDADRHDPEKDGVQAFGAMMSENGFDPDTAPLVATPSDGNHHFFRQPDGKQFGNADSRLYRGRKLKDMGINVRGHGGYVIAPGTVMADGRFYELFGSIEEAPPLPQWLVDVLDAPDEPKARNVPVTPIVRTHHSDARIRAYCDAAVGEETAKVASAGKGSRNNTLNEAAFALGQLVGAGWLTEAEVSALLENAAAQCGLGSFEAKRTIRSGISAGKQNPRVLEDDAAAPIDDYDPSILLKEIREAAAEEGSDQDNAQFAVGGEWTHPGGIIEDIADWIEATSRRPNRPLAVAAGIAIVGTVCGRIIAGPTMSGTHLYTVCIGDTAIGKDRPMKAIKSILTETGLPHLSQTGKFMSSSAIENAIVEYPCHVAVTDEIGSALFAKMSHKRASTHESSMSNALRELWSSSFDVFDTSRRAGDSSRTVRSPAFSIYGVSTTDEFYRSLGAGVVENGLLNRFLIVKADKRASPRDVDPKLMMKPPRHICDALLDLLPPVEPGNNLVSAGGCYGAHSQPLDPLVVQWASDDVRSAYMDFENELLAFVDANPDMAPYLGRTAEMAIRLATVYAVSRFGRRAEITIEALEWGKCIARNSAQTMMDDVKDRIVENDAQAKYKMVEGVVRAARGEFVTLTKIKRDLRGRIGDMDLVRNVIPAIRVGRNIEWQDKCENGKGERFRWSGKIS